MSERYEKRILRKLEKEQRCEVKKKSRLINKTANGTGTQQEQKKKDKK